MFKPPEPPRGAPKFSSGPRTAPNEVEVRLVEMAAHAAIAACTEPKAAAWGDVLQRAIDAGVNGLMADLALDALVAAGRFYEPILGRISEVPT